MKKRLLQILIAVTAVSFLTFGCSKSTDETSEELETDEIETAEDGNSDDHEVDESNNPSELPAYEYPGSEEMYSEICAYIIDELGAAYDKSDVSIPYLAKVAVDDSNEDDIVFYGDFWIDNYDLDGDILKTASGGNYPGAIHLKKTDNGYEVVSMDMVEDGSDFDPSARKIFGEHYDDFMKIYSDSDALNTIRKQFISDYVKANGLEIKAYQDYGWDPVEI